MLSTTKNTMSESPNPHELLEEIHLILQEEETRLGRKIKREEAIELSGNLVKVYVLEMSTFLNSIDTSTCNTGIYIDE